MTKLFTYLFILIISVTLVSATPKIQPYINDFANILSDQEEINLNIQADSIEKNTTYEIAIVTVKNTEGLDPIEYAYRIGDENGVGKKDKDNGMVILISMETRKIVIATGRGSESIINDAKAGRIIDNAVPSFKDEKYYNGFSSMLDDLSSEIVKKEVVAIVKENPPSPNSDFSWWLVLFPLGMFIIFLIIIMSFREEEDYSSSDDSDDDSDDKPDKGVYKYKTVRGKRKRQYLYGAAAGAVLASRSETPSYSSSSNRSSGGFSGGSFGGSVGGFGGSGAGRSF